KTVFSKEEAEKMCQLDLQLIKEIAERVNTIKSDVDNMIEARKRANVIECEEEKANTYHDAVLPFFDKIRYQVDKLEMIIDDEMWPLPKYRELLFIR
ncbi:MAG TPA: glutamine synthetase type III, partial [Paludibacteraceae bacterium]|nr:glutamine synthetase type III [Paludibacteraceae bacterium]